MSKKRVAKRLPTKSAKQKSRARKLMDELYQHYPDPKCELDHRNPYELLIATILSAQTTDVRVNLVTPELFENYPTPEEMGEAPIEHLEELVRSTGFYRQKARSIKETSQTRSEEHTSELQSRGQ